MLSPYLCQISAASKLLYVEEVANFDRFPSEETFSGVFCRAVIEHVAALTALSLGFGCDRLASLFHGTRGLK
jgi:hypothetical protein